MCRGKIRISGLSEIRIYPDHFHNRKPRPQNRLFGFEATNFGFQNGPDKSGFRIIRISGLNHWCESRFNRGPTYYYLVQSGKKRIRNTRSYTFFVVTFHNQSLNLLSYFTLFYVAVSSSPVWYLVVVLDLAAAAVCY